MIKQLKVTVKTMNDTLVYSEMGDIVCSSDDPMTITLPSPNSGLWYRVSNVGSGIVTIAHVSSELTTLKQTEQCLCLANDSEDWFFSKGGGSGITWDEIQEKPEEYPSKPAWGDIQGKPTIPERLIDLIDAPASYAGQAGKALVVNSIENGLAFGASGGDTTTGAFDFGSITEASSYTWDWGSLT